PPHASSRLHAPPHSFPTRRSSELSSPRRTGPSVGVGPATSRLPQRQSTLSSISTSGTSLHVASTIRDIEACSSRSQREIWTSTTAVSSVLIHGLSVTSRPVL